jgi:hypothetical protein
MTIFPFQISEALHFDNRISKLKLSTILEKDQVEQADRIDISTEGKKRQIKEQARSEMLDQIRKS